MNYFRFICLCRTQHFHGLFTKIEIESIQPVLLDRESSALYITDAAVMWVQTYKHVRILREFRNVQRYHFRGCVADGSGRCVSWAFMTPRTCA